ncbi:MAG: hypothetical protein NT167_14355, partial [Verrucomicrobia bacterium]|nr:hypothetical protein [Verrucomicrobiota bacterium]
MKNTNLLMVLACLSMAGSDMAYAQDVRLTSSARTTNGFAMQWSNAVAGQAYTLQTRDRLSNSIWLTLDSPQPWPTV